MFSTSNDLNERCPECEGLVVECESPSHLCPACGWQDFTTDDRQDCEESEQSHTNLLSDSQRKERNYAPSPKKECR